jgi:uncharacterized phage protein gp47/JayE
MTIVVSDSGVLIETLDTVVADVNAEFLAEFGSGPNGIDTTPKSYTGRQNTIIAGRIVALEQLIAELSSLLNLNNAQGRFLDFIGTLLGEARLPAANATIPAIVHGTPGFNVGDRRVRYARNSTIWRVPIGTLVGANGQSAVDLVADDAGTATVDGTPIEAFQDGSDQWVILDTNTNFTAVESTADSSAGQAIEGDPSYRARLRVAGRGSDKSTEPGVLRALQRAAGSTARIDNNRTLVPNANGVDGKSIEALVDSGSDAAVAQAILDSYSDTAGFFGSSTAVAYDANGTAVNVRFTRIVRINVVWDVTINTAGAEVPLPDNAEDVVQTALAAYTTELPFGIDVQPEEGEAAIREALPKGSIPGGGLVALVGLKGGPPPAAATIVITSRQRAYTNPEPQAAEVVGTTQQPFNVIAGQILQLSVDGGSMINVVFTVADFQVISQATALELATAINNRTSGIVAGTELGALVIRSATTGATSSIQVGTGSTIALLTTLGLTAAPPIFGVDGDITVTIT